MTATVTNTNGALQVVINLVQPGGNGTGMAAQASNINMAQTKLERFRKGHPKALGTAQIMIGIVMILMGIVMAVNADSSGVITGTHFWASLIYIAAGSLAIAADNKLNKCLVNATLGMGVFATIAAGIGIIFYSLDTTGILMRAYCSRPYSDSSQYSSYNDCPRFLASYQVRSKGIAGIMLVLSVLEFIISICMSSFACKAACNSEPQVFVIRSEMIQSSTLAEGNGYTPLMDREVEQNPKVTDQGERPPQYVP